MATFTLKDISDQSFDSVSTLAKRRKVRKLGRKQGKVWHLTPAEAQALLEPGVRGNPALQKRRAVSKLANGE